MDQPYDGGVVLGCENGHLVLHVHDAMRFGEVVFRVGLKSEFLARVLVHDQVHLGIGPLAEPLHHLIVVQVIYVLTLARQDEGVRADDTL